MVKNWADHCSSDDEEDHSERVESMAADGANDGPGGDADLTAAPDGDNPDLYQKYDDDSSRIDDGSRQHQQEGHDGGNQLEEDRPPRQYDFPTEPPFTAFVGNLAYTIKDAQTLGEEMIHIARDQLGIDIVILEAKIIKDRETDRPRGFGYIEVETLDILQKLMELNEIGASLAGRRLQFDTANQGNRNKNNRNNNRGSNNNNDGDRRRYNNYNDSGSPRRQSGTGFGDIDGSKFRGGRYRGSSYNTAGDSEKAEGDDNIVSPPTGQRPVLKLQPRTIPLDNALPPPATASQVLSSSSSSIPSDHAEKRAEKGDSGVRNSTQGGRSYDRGGQKDNRQQSNSDSAGDWRKRSTNSTDATMPARTGGRGSRDDQNRRSGNQYTGRGGGSDDRLRSSGRGGGDDRRSNASGGGRGTTGRGDRLAPGGRHSAGGRDGSSGRSFTRNSGRSSQGSFPSSNSSGSNKDEKKPTEEKKKVYIPPPEPVKVPEPKKPVNKFAALGYDSDSD